MNLSANFLTLREFSQSSTRRRLTLVTIFCGKFHPLQLLPEIFNRKIEPRRSSPQQMILEAFRTLGKPLRGCSGGLSLLNGSLLLLTLKKNCFYP